jgi:hypothetical protein
VAQDKSGCGLQSVQQLEARALRRADAVDELERLLYAAKGNRRQQELRDDRAGPWASLFRPNRWMDKVEKLERDVTRARASLKIAVDELHQAHCQQLRTAPWSGRLLAPTEAGLRNANEDDHPFELVRRAGKRALNAMYKIDASGDSDSVALIVLTILLAVGGGRFSSSSGLTERIEAMNQAGDAIQSFANAMRSLDRAHPELGMAADSPSLSAIAKRLSGVRTRFGAMAVSGQGADAKRTIAAILTTVGQASGSESGDVAEAQGRLAEVNHQIALAAWSKIPARLRPAGR